MWQTVTTLGVSVALLALVGDDLLSLAIAATLIVGVCAWYAATVSDSALWFARNQAIATNIERVFLDDPDDLRLIQPYFAEHRKGLLISHFQIPLWLCRGLAAVVVALYAEGHTRGDSLVEWFPYAAVVLYVVVELVSYATAKGSYDTLLAEAPGKGTGEPEGLTTP